ncbi:MAG: hypothetical protein H7175_19945, partial [Burkholderiales bacterium]|nr:hypothetical protein [Anaerolineae bacterium]
TYRYAANLSQGVGLVYNPGQHVLGTTTPGYAALLSAAGLVFGADTIPAASRIINALCMLIAGGCAYLIAQRLTRSRLVAALALGLTLLSYETLYGSLAGMESPLFLTLLGVALLALVYGRTGPAALAAGMLALVRPEGAFVIGLFGLTFAVQTLRARHALPLHKRFFNRETLTIAAGLLLPGLIWALIATTYYGSPIPQSVIAKRAGLYPLQVYDTVAGVVAYLGQSFGIRELSDENLLLFALIAGVSTLVLAFGALWIWRHARQLWLIPALVFIMLAFYATSKTQLFTYYFAFFNPLQSICWWTGLYLLAQRLVGRKGRAARPYLAAITGMLTLLPSLAAYPYASMINGQALPENFSLPILRLHEYDRITRDLDLPDGTTVLMPEIGVLGFYMNGIQVLDSAGLVSPEAVVYFPVPAEQRPALGAGVIPPQMVHDYQPDVIISLEIFGRNGIFNDDWLWENYQIIMERRGDWLPWDSEALWVLARNDFAENVSITPD